MISHSKLATFYSLFFQDYSTLGVASVIPLFSFLMIFTSFEKKKKKKKLATLESRPILRGGYGMNDVIVESFSKFTTS
jgi:hypothetical protein